MTRYEIAIQFNTCEEAFMSIYGVHYNESIYACYNEEIGEDEKRILCPFAKNDSCRSKELPM
jgi:hypothetical protein